MAKNIFLRPQTAEVGLIHKSSHRNGSNIDLRYMGDNGKALTGNTAAADGSVDRNKFIISQFASRGLGGAITGDQTKYGQGPVPSFVQSLHADHMHFQKALAKREEPRIRPGQR